MVEHLRSEDKPIIPWLPILLTSSYWITSKQDKVVVTNLKNLPKLQIFLILKKKTIHATHLLKLLDEMYKHKSKMDLASIVEDTEWTQFCPKMDRQTDERTKWNQFTRLQLRWARDITRVASSTPCVWEWILGEVMSTIWVQIQWPNRKI